MGRLEGAATLVMEAASGIGAACALRFAREGARLAGIDVQQEAGGDWAEARACVADSLFEIADVRDEAAVAGVVERVRDRFGRIDALVVDGGFTAGHRFGVGAMMGLG